MKFGGQHIEATGLNGDYINAWAYLGLIHVRFSNGKMPEQEFHRKLMEPVKNYDTYIKEHYPTCTDAMLADVKPAAKAALDQLVAEFNALSVEVKSQRGTLNKYNEKLKSIIEGEQTPE